MAALATIREWRNSFAPINRVPLDVLSLIPTHLSFKRDLFRVSSVCRHWRRTFVQHAALWSRLRLTASTADLHVKTLLERSRGSALDVIVARRYPVMDRIRAETLALFSPHTQRIRNLDFVHSRWPDIQDFSSRVVSGPLPLLRTLKIDVVYEHYQPYTWVMTPPSLSLFTSAINLKEFRLYSAGLPFLDHFFFPNLTTLELSATPKDGFPGSQLLNFLEASPTLRAVHVKIGADALLGDVPPGRVVTLPNVETFNLTMVEDRPGCKIAAHISCPSARSTSLLYEQDAYSTMPPEIFPASVSWDVIARQCTASSLDEVVLEITTAKDPIITCILTFLSLGPTVLTLGFKVTTGCDEDEGGEFAMTLGERHAEIVSEASMTIRTHPLLANVKRLRIRDRYITRNSNQRAQIASEVRELFESTGPLDALTLDVFDLRPYLGPFPHLPEFYGMDQSNGFPPIKKLKIAQPLRAPAERECMAAVVELAKSQYAAGVPFELVVIRTENPSLGAAERLQPWVDVVHCCSEMCVGDDC